ncbi:unnamed protein product [Adineta ricciae]|uniref:Cytochrome b561 domain-containing protein n=1 Tax=Adineta ricciae TaxID=249248 RepID=A0A815RNA9_ADIRI|nr:unnamed protein product [Adineta ricciae]
MAIITEGMYPIFLILAEIFGLLSVILVGLLFDGRIYTDTYNWPKNPFTYHPLMMTLGLVFCYGNAILIYRTFRTTPKLFVKVGHALFLILSLVLGIFGFIAIIRSKNLGKRSHFMTYHSWLGLTTLILFVFQWICGFVCFLFPQMSLEIRKTYMPSHRLGGKVIFMSAVIAVLTGLSEYGMGSSFFTPNDIERQRRLIMNFFCVFTSLFALVVIYLLSNPEYQRPPEEHAED